MKRVAVAAVLTLMVATPGGAAAQAARVPGPVAHRLAGTMRPAAAPRPVTPPAMRRSGGTVGLVVGGIIGGAFGTFVGAGACSFNDDDQRNCTLRMPLFGLAGAAAAGALGWLLGQAVGTG